MYTAIVYRKCAPPSDKGVGWGLEHRGHGVWGWRLLAKWNILHCERWVRGGGEERTSTIGSLLVHVDDTDTDTEFEFIY